MHRVWDFCFIDARTIVLAIKAEYGLDGLQVISLPFDKGDLSGVFLGLPSLQGGYKHHLLELKTDGGKLIGLCVGIDTLVQYPDIRESDSDYLLVIDRPGLRTFLAEAQGDIRFNWVEWESKITTILAIENNSYQMAWEVLGRRIVINAKSETLPFAKPILGVKDKNEAEDIDHKISHCGGRLVVVDFGSYRPVSVAKAGDECGNVIRCRPQGGLSLAGVRNTSSEEPPCRIWMERAPSCPAGCAHISENMVFIRGVSC
jgi:hypothetical protein